MWSGDLLTSPSNLPRNKLITQLGYIRKHYTKKKIKTTPSKYKFKWEASEMALWVGELATQA